MKAVVSIDSFKGSLTSAEAGHAAERGILRAFPGASVTVLPLADGGEGTAETLTDGLHGTALSVSVHGPLGDPVSARFGILPDGTTAVTEMASASGITLVKKEELDPERANTAGFGELLKEAYRKGCRKFIVGIGGSATTEAGIGMLSSLGIRFLDAEGRELPPVFDSLIKVEAVDLSSSDRDLLDCEFQIACDVTNPLSGPSGAVPVYGPQKGVRPENIEVMDAAMKHFGETIDRLTGQENRDRPGSGAAGGLGFAFMSFFKKASFESGADIVFRLLHTEEALSGADLFITGEGRLDAQTASGKGPMRAAMLAKQKGAAVIMLAGSVEGEASMFSEAADACFPIVRGVTTLEKAMDRETALYNMEETAYQAVSLLKAGMRMGQGDKRKHK